MKFLSLIIPVYNVEKYLDNCIKSVIIHNPKKLGIEIILVDDGSTDNSGNLCDEYAEDYEYIIVVHKKNGGLSSARNEGIKHATGQYIIFMDSDDWWNPDVDLNNVINFVKAHNQTEMFLFTAYDYFENDGYYMRKDHKNLRSLKTTSPKDYYESLLKNGNLEVAAYTKIFLRTFIQNNSLTFRKHLLSEDNEWMMRVLRKVKKIEIIDEPLYIYRMHREGSISNSIKKKNIEDLLKIVYLSQRYYKRYPYDELKKQELCYASYLWFSALGLSTLLDKNEQKTLKSKFYWTSDVCKYSRSPKTRSCYFVYKLMGLEATAQILGMYIKLKRERAINRTRVPDISEVTCI